jgi:hypothetical protein
VAAKFLDLNRVRVMQLCLDTLTKVERKKDRQKEEERKKTILIFDTDMSNGKGVFTVRCKI